MYDLKEVYSGKHLNIEDNKRKTYYNSENPYYVIGMFGGSTLYGSMAENDCVTIPSFISKKLDEKGYNVKVVNYGVSGYYSTQEMIKYLWLLKNEKEKPHLVVFYDGGNDAFFPIMNDSFVDLPNTYPTFYLIREVPYISFIMKSNTFYLIKRVVNKLFQSNKEMNIYSKRNLVNSIMENHVNNMKIISAFSSVYNVETLHFWQPALSPSIKKLSDWERKQWNVYNKYHPSSIKYYPFTCTDDVIKNYSRENFIFICKIFENESSTIYVD